MQKVNVGPKSGSKTEVIRSQYQSSSFAVGSMTHVTGLQPALIIKIICNGLQIL